MCSMLSIRNVQPDKDWDTRYMTVIKRTHVTDAEQRFMTLCTDTKKDHLTLRSAFQMTLKDLRAVIGAKQESVWIHPLLLSKVLHSLSTGASG